MMITSSFKVGMAIALPASIYMGYKLWKYSQEQSVQDFRPMFGIPMKLDYTQATLNRMARKIQHCFMAFHAKRKAAASRRIAALSKISNQITAFACRRRTLATVKSVAKAAQKARRVISTFVTKSIRRNRLKINRNARMYALQVHIASAANKPILPNDSVYVQIKVNGQPFRTESRKTSWDEDFLLPRQVHSMRPVVEVRIFKEQSFIWDAFLGKFKFSLEDMDGSIKRVKLEGKRVNCWMFFALKQVFSETAPKRTPHLTIEPSTTTTSESIPAPPVSPTIA